MTVAYLLMFVFGLLLLASWAGWGAALERVVLGRVVADRALHAGWGLAWTTVVGGVLNLAGWISPSTTLAFVATGLALLIGDAGVRRHGLRRRWTRWKKGLRRRPTRAVVVALAALVLLSVYAANVCSKYANPHDDLQAYFVYPTKMTQTGSLGSEPFSERRILCLGGMAFLHSIVLGVADWRYLALIDPGASLLLSCALVLGIARDARARGWTAALAVMLLVIVPPPRVNLTSLVSGLALFLTLFRTLSRTALRGRPGAGGAVLVGVAAAGLCSLKSTFVPACALLVVGAYVLKGFQSRAGGAALRALALSGGTTLLLLAPWMISSYESSGTLLYPFLGRGFHGSAYGSTWGIQGRLTGAAIAQGVTTALTDLRVLPIWILGAGLLIQRRGTAARGALLAFLGATLVSHLALTTLYPELAYRYSWAFLFGCLLALLVYLSPAGPAVGRRGWPAARGLLPIGLAVAMLGVAHWSQATRYLWSRPQAVRVAVDHSRSPGFKRRWARRYTRMQRAVPEGAVLLTRLQYPFLLDFAGHTVFIADLPGGASPPPGMPSFRGGEPLAAYLCGQGVQYVAYSYAQEASFDRATFRSRLHPGTHPWPRAQARLTFDFQSSLDELGRTRHRIFDDGDVFVLDLGKTPTGVRVGCRASTPASPSNGQRRAH